MKNLVKGLNKLCQALHVIQLKLGWKDSNIPQRLILIHSEISEMFEAYRKNKYVHKTSIHLVELQTDNVHWFNQFEAFIKNTMEDEAADVAIRLFAFCAENNIDLEKHIELKTKYNKLRPDFKDGSKKC